MPQPALCCSLAFWAESASCFFSRLELAGLDLRQCFLPFGFNDTLSRRSGTRCAGFRDASGLHLRRDITLNSFVDRFSSGETFCQKRYLPGVMRFMLADVEPFPIDVYFPFAKLLRFTTKQPRVIALFEFGQRVLACFVQNIEVVIEIVAFDRLTPSVAEVHGRVPLFLDIVGPAIPILILECVHAVVSLRSGE